jgi:hypothetical protein
LPDGLFSNQKSKFGKFWGVLQWKMLAYFYGHLVHFTDFWRILWTLSKVRGTLVYFSRFGILYQEKSGNPGTENLEQRKLGGK